MSSNTSNKATMNQEIEQIPNSPEMSGTSGPPSPTLLTGLEALNLLGLHPGFGNDLHTDLDIQKDLKAGDRAKALMDLNEMVWDIIHKVGQAQMKHNDETFKLLTTRDPPFWLEGDQEEIRMEIARCSVLGNSPLHFLKAFAKDGGTGKGEGELPSLIELQFRNLSDIVTLNHWWTVMLTKWNRIFEHYFPKPIDQIDLDVVGPGKFIDRWFYFIRGTQLMVNEFRHMAEIPQDKLAEVENMLEGDQPWKRDCESGHAPELAGTTRSE
ncbi:hypothetical protein BN1723_004906 [Verticillium longisporum]|uniref:Uncharacterized protein n=1 Tax=Verticillium longisporum TaxID=100787 RepID=A0A0G4L6F4_VERLO|nr:hypothetical protein BN1708_012130 [Verticillium longisporum]CRK40662.1 hypothetical protein BN1723_004906 [Verticillium longisporum]